MSEAPKHAVITGAAQGIGRCIARTFAEKGYKVFLIDVNEEELTHTTHTHLSHFHSRGLLSSAVYNLRDPSSIRSTISTAATFLDNRIDILVNNASIASPKWKDNRTFADEATLEEWQAYVETNLTAPFVVSQACIPYMRNVVEGEGGGGGQGKGGAGPCIIHIGSFRSQQSDPDQEGYASTKAGTSGLMHSMAISASRWGIRVNVVSPGRIKTGHECKEADEKGTKWEDVHEEKDVEDHPANRAGRPEDIAEAVVWLVGAGFVNAQEIVVDGGVGKVKAS